MGVPDSSFLDWIERVRSWISWGGSDLYCLSREFAMPDFTYEICCECQKKFTSLACRYHCQSCSRVLCGNCLMGYENIVISESNSAGVVEEKITGCRFCAEVRKGTGRMDSDQVSPSVSPRESQELSSPCSGDGIIESEAIQIQFVNSQEHDYSPNAVNIGMVSLCQHPSAMPFCCSPSRSNEEETEDSGKNLSSPSSEYCQAVSDVDSSVSARNESYNFRSVSSSPSASPSRNNFISYRAGHSVQKGLEGRPKFQNYRPSGQEAMIVLGKPDTKAGDADNSVRSSDKLPISEYQSDQYPLDLESNGLIWLPPPPEDEDDETETKFFEYDDEDDDIGASGEVFTFNNSFVSMLPGKERSNGGKQGSLSDMIHRHFRALVSQLLQGESIDVGKDSSTDCWLDIVTTLAWKAANFVKPDTTKGGSMDPGAYVKVKCIATGSPNESSFVKGIVCTKNIKHKRMTSQYRTPRLLLLGGALDYQRVPNQLASFDTLLQQEIDHLKMIVSKIEAHRPNVLLVEKSVSSYAQEYLLAKEISLVLNVKRPLLERIARCTGALITPSVDNILTTRLGHCELFRLERVSEEHARDNQLNKKPSRTLMYFEGCPRRLGCTILLKGTRREELKKVKHIFQYAVFAAYHLSLETSFLADEGASLPKTSFKPSIAVPERTTVDSAISVVPTICEAAADISHANVGFASLDLGFEQGEPSYENLDSGHCSPPPPPPPLGFMDCRIVNQNPEYDAYPGDLMSNISPGSSSLNLYEDAIESFVLPFETTNQSHLELLETTLQEPGEAQDLTKPERFDESEAAGEYFSGADGNQSILVSFSSRCVLNGSVCERSRLLRIKFYGSFDKPLGRYLHDDLFDPISYCRSCKEPAEAHIQCFTHQQGSLTINVRRLSSLKLPGERDGKIWMWHRCLKCAHFNGIPPATRRVVMSDAAWGLSFGKFLELSFSNHATANRVATCGHSLQRDCLRYYGFGSMVAFFRYSPIDILSVRLPPSVLEFNDHTQQKWIREEAMELQGKVKTLYKEISDILTSIDHRIISSGYESSETTHMHNHIIELKDLIVRERNGYNALLEVVDDETSQPGRTIDILELNRLRHSLLIGSHIWDRRLYSLDSLFRTSSGAKVTPADGKIFSIEDNISPDLTKRDGNSEFQNIQESLKDELEMEKREDKDTNLSLGNLVLDDYRVTPGQDGTGTSSSPSSLLSDKIDSAWIGTDQVLPKSQETQNDNQPSRRLTAPVRVYSFDSATRIQERILKGFPPSSLHLSSLRSFCTRGDPVSNVLRTHSLGLPREAQRLGIVLGSTELISSASQLANGVRLLLPQSGYNDMVIAVYDSEPTSIILYALSSKDYGDWIADRLNEPGGSKVHANNPEDSTASSISAWQSFGSLDMEHSYYGSYRAEDAKKTPHLRLSFEDDSSAAGGKVKFSVTCYFAMQFDALWKKCCPSGVDFIRSLSRCRKWMAQGGKSNVYFAKSLDERFIIKQVTKTELDSFEQFAPEYFKYLTESLSTGSPTCLAKILGLYQVTVKHLKGGKETKMDLMVMENLFFKRNISKVYDLKGSARARYSPDSTGANSVLLDTNLLETLRTKPLFLGSKAKRILERAVWNDTSLLASVDVMDYSLLVGVDEERKELVLGIIDFMRQYTWDKHLETWVKASGILGGPKNASPTIISPKQYKRRFRKAMTSYFLTVPDHWPS